MQPTLQALLLADFVYTDQDTGKKVIAGVFDSLLITKIAPEPVVEPSQEGSQEKESSSQGGKQVHVRDVRRAGSPYAFISLTNVHGERAFELRYVELDSYEALFTTSFRVESPDPLATVEIVVAVPKLPERAGVFALELLCENELIGSHRVHVRQAEQQR